LLTKWRTIETEFHPDTIQEMLYIPTNLVVTKATCDLLRLQIPLYFRANPLQLFLDTVVLHLEEPDVVPPAPCKFAQLWAVDAEEARAPQSEADRRRAKQNMDLLYNMTYEVKNLTLLVTTKSNRNTVMRFDVRNTRVESVNRDWLVVDLAASRDIDAANATETLYKLTRIKSISISVSDPHAGVDTVLADNAPAQYRQTASYNLNTGQLIASRYEFVFERLDFQWDTARWHLLVDTFSSIGTVFSKEVPIDPAAPKAEVYDYQVTYEVFIAEWSMVFDAADVTHSQRRTKMRRRRRESLPSNSNPVADDSAAPASSPLSPGAPPRGTVVVHNGVKLAGVRWKFTWSPQTKKRVKASELDDCNPKTEPPNSEIDVCESLVQLTLPSFTCTAIGRPFDASLRYPALLSRSDATTATKAAAAASFARVQRGAQQVLNMRVLEAYYSQLQSGPRKLTRRPKPVSPALIAGSKVKLANNADALDDADVALAQSGGVAGGAGGSNHPHAIRSRHASFQLGKEGEVVGGDDDGLAHVDVGASHAAGSNPLTRSARFDGHVGEARPSREDNLPLLAVSFMQRWRASQEKAARTTNELRVVMASMLVAFERTALDRLALFFSAKNPNSKPRAATPPSVTVTPASPVTPVRGAAAAAQPPKPAAIASEMSAADARSAFRAQGMQRRSGTTSASTAAAVAAAKANIDAGAAAGASPSLAPPPLVDAGDMWTRMSRRFVSTALPPRRVSSDERLDGVDGGAKTPAEEADEAEAEAEGWATWAATTRMYLDIYDTHLIVPDVPGAGQLSNTSIDFAIEHLSVTTRPAWNAVPKLDSELAILNRETDVVSEIKHDTSSLTSDRMCFQIRLVGISCVLRLFPQDSSADDSAVTVKPVLEPASIVLYGRYLRKLRDGGKNRARLELMLECSHLNVTVTARQYEYFLFAAQLYAQWSVGMVQRVNQPVARKRSDKYARRNERLQRRGRVATASNLVLSTGNVGRESESDEDEDDDDDAGEADNSVAAIAAAAAAKTAALTPPSDALQVPSASALDRRPSYLHAIGKSARFALGISPLPGRQRQLSISSAAAAAAAAFAVPVSPAASPVVDDDDDDDDGDKPKRLARTNSIDREALKLLVATRREQAAKQAPPPPSPRPPQATMRVALAVRIDNSVFLVPLSWSSDASLAAQLKPSKVAFSAAQLALDVDDEKRCVVARLAGAEAIGLDHPSLPAYVSLVPRARNTSFFGDNNSYRLLEVRFVRLGKEPNAPPTQLPRAHLTVQLRNASLMFVAKTEDSVTVERIVESLRAYATDLLSYFTEHNREVKETLDVDAHRRLERRRRRRRVDGRAELAGHRAHQGRGDHHVRAGAPAGSVGGDRVQRTRRALVQQQRAGVWRRRRQQARAPHSGAERHAALAPHAGQRRRHADSVGAQVQLSRLEERALDQVGHERRHRRHRRRRWRALARGRGGRSAAHGGRRQGAAGAGRGEARGGGARRARAQAAARGPAATRRRGLAGAPRRAHQNRAAAGRLGHAARTAAVCRRALHAAVGGSRRAARVGAGVDDSRPHDDRDHQSAAAHHNAAPRRHRRGVVERGRGDGGRVRGVERRRRQHQRGGVRRRGAVVAIRAHEGATADASGSGGLDGGGGVDEPLRVAQEPHGPRRQRRRGVGADIAGVESGAAAHLCAG
jgi:hypothetical protein